jgi:hypothetical protein
VPQLPVPQLPVPQLPVPQLPVPPVPVTPAADPPGREAGPASPERPAWEQDPWGDGGLGAAAPAWPDVARTGPAAASAPPPAGPAAPAAPAGPAGPATAHPPWEDVAPGSGAAGAAVDPLRYVPPAPAATLTAAFAKAAGVAAATETLNGARERQAVGYIGWPPGRLATRLRSAGRAPAGKLAGDLTDVAQAQRADIDNAITAFADEVGGPLPEPWSRTVRAAARSRAGDAQSALGAAVARGLPPRDKVTGWWRLIALAQWLLMLLALGGLAWIGLILSHGSHKSSSLISDTSLVPWLAVMVVALLLLGWLIESWCQNMVVLAADREREQANQAIMTQVVAITGDLVLAPVGRELAHYERFRAELATARARSF